MSTTVPTKAQVLKLYRSYMRASQSFSSYNFRTYFLRRSRDMFRSTLLPKDQAALSSPFSNAGAAITKSSPSSLVSPSALKQSGNNTHSGSEASQLSQFYRTAVEDLKVLQRAALTNRLYEGEKLVVEAPRLIVGGGGAGAEASQGGAGQPDAGPHSGEGAPTRN